MSKRKHRLPRPQAPQPAAPPPAPPAAAAPAPPAVADTRLRATPFVPPARKPPVATPAVLVPAAPPQHAPVAPAAPPPAHPAVVASPVPKRQRATPFVPPRKPPQPAAAYTPPVQTEPSVLPEAEAVASGNAVAAEESRDFSLGSMVVPDVGMPDLTYAADELIPDGTEEGVSAPRSVYTARCTLTRLEVLRLQEERREPVPEEDVVQESQVVRYRHEPVERDPHADARRERARKMMAGAMDRGKKWWEQFHSRDEKCEFICAQCINTILQYGDGCLLCTRFRQTVRPVCSHCAADVVRQSCEQSEEVILSD